MQGISFGSYYLLTFNRICVIVYKSVHSPLLGPLSYSF